MALPKILKELDRKLDRVLAILEAPVFPIADAPPQPLDPETVAAAIDYDSYSAKEIVERVDSLSDAERAALAVYEAGKGNRVSVLKALGA